MIEFKNITKSYKTGASVTNALKNVSFDINPNEITIILGPSGSGKSTALNILGGMDNPTDGQVIYNGKDLSQSSEKELTIYRQQSVGFVFQFYNLIANLNVVENVGIAGNLNNGTDLETENLIKQVGLQDRKDNFPEQLSGGEMQRVAIARALAKKPKILLCDEPTGALDSETSKKIFKLLKRAKNEETAVVIVTHFGEIAPIADKVIKIKDGQINQIIRNDNPLEVDEVNWE